MIERYAIEFKAGRNPADIMITFPDLFNGVDKGGWALQCTPPELAAFKPEVNHNNRAFAVHTVARSSSGTSAGEAGRCAEGMEGSLGPKWKGRVGMDPLWRWIAVQSIVAYRNKTGIRDPAQKLRDNDVRFFEASAGV